MKKYIILSLTTLILFTGCSAKRTINPEGPYQESEITQQFEQEQEEKKQQEAWIKIGEAKGYAKAKKELEPLIPYFEAIRASAEVHKNGGLCLPPLFIDRTNKSGITALLGKAHFCEEYTVENIMKMAKHGIPGLPDGYQKTNTVNNTNTSLANFKPAGITLPRDGNVFFKRNPINTQQKVSVRVKNTAVNAAILAKLNTQHSIIEERNQNGTAKNLLVTFNSAKDMKNFCSRYTICK